ncbi:MAG: hypothetical protein JSV88_07615 [Candidatus Aminicenantes bacterium]|nr:MAG: hypothetical protein JSV88_07615 [Candidatus Aminicenantes bacterium]
MRRKLLVLIFVVLMVVVGYVQFRYDSHRNYFAGREVFVTLPPGKTLRILSFGFRNLVADMLFIWSIQFYSTYYLTNIYDYLEHVFEVITDLNPRYKEPYIVGSWIMALEAMDVKMAMRLLQKGARNMPDEWIFDYECGFYAYKNLKDYALAEEFFTKAASKPNAPPLIKRKRAHMVYMKDNLNYAYELWMEIYKKAQDYLERAAARNHLHQIKFEMDKKFLEQRIALFKSIYKRYPYNLEELKRARLVRGIPRDFDGNHYIYRPKKGIITAEKVLRWKK